MTPKNGKYRMIDSEDNEVFVAIRNNKKSFTIKLTSDKPKNPCLEMCEFLYNDGSQTISNELPYYETKFWNDEEFMVFVDGLPPCHFEKTS